MEDGFTQTRCLADQRGKCLNIKRHRTRWILRSRTGNTLLLQTYTFINYSKMKALLNIDVCMFKVVRDVVYGKPYPIGNLSELPPWLKRRVAVKGGPAARPPTEVLKTNLRPKRRRQPSRMEVSAQTFVMRHVIYNMCPIFGSILTLIKL